MAARPVVGAQQKNGMATLKEIEQRLKSVKNIEKITKSMKVVASTKLTRAERAMKQAKKYGAANEELFKNSEIGSDNGDAKVLYVAISSDRGLCGGIHSSVTKATLRALNANPEARVAVLGDKPKAQLARSRTDDFVITFNQIGRDIPTFAEAAAIADEIKTKGGEWDVVKIIYNKYISAISYEPTELVVTNAKSLNEAAGFKAYEQEEDSTGDIAEFSLANALYLALVEGHAAEQSARRTAMDNASGNAADMIGKLNLQFNRARQGKITGELIEIITGASAL